MKMRRSFAFVLLALLALAVSARAETNVTPTILVYSGTDSGFAKMLAALIQQDDRIDAKVEVVTTPDVLSIATALPQTECVVVYISNRAEIEGLEAPLASFFEVGGGLVGMRDVCYKSTAGRLATDVFPIYGNKSVQQYSPREKRARTYIQSDVTEINKDVPESFELISMGTYYSSDAQGSYLKVPGDYSVLYKDNETGSPLVVAYQNEEGGRSVALPGIWIVSSPRVDIYYGHLVEDQNFARLFTNSVLWAAQGSSHFSNVKKDLSTKIEEAKTRQQRLKEQAEEAEKRQNLRRVLLLSGLWIVGLLTCGIIVKKLILAPIESEE